MGSISTETATEIVSHYYGLDATAVALPGDIAFNYKIESSTAELFLLKITGPEIPIAFLEFQQELNNHLTEKSPSFQFNQILPNKEGATLCIDVLKKEGFNAQLYIWVSGRIWADINPKTPSLRKQLGSMAGACTNALKDFKHPEAHRSFPWNLAESDWTRAHLHRFDTERQAILRSHLDRFTHLQSIYTSLPKNVVHNDLNDHNIIVSEVAETTEVLGLIDFGDVVYTQVINDVAIVIAYGSMNVPDPLEAAIDILKGYAGHYKFNSQEVSCLYALVAMRLITTVTQAALRKQNSNSTAYHSISEQDAWDLLAKWDSISEEFATYSFRHAVGLTAHPQEEAFRKWASTQDVTFEALFPHAIPTLNAKAQKIPADCFLLDLKVSSKWIGSRHEFNELDLFQFRIEQLQKEHPTHFIADGYSEPRPIYTSSSYDKDGNEGPESRTVHLGVDFWLAAHTSVHSLFDGEVVTAINDAGYKEYGGLIILKHHEDDLTFFTLYGHLTADSPQRFTIGDQIKKGDRIGALGTAEENGQWSPHLHFQIMLSMLDYEIDFPGVTYPSQMNIWKSICPDPNLLFKNDALKTQYDPSEKELLNFRQSHLGKGLSVSYQQPLHIVRGDGAHLLDTWGQKYLDTVNNVAHVGHEHPTVVRAAQKQIALLNTNTRYLHPAINQYAERLLSTLPEELSVLHFVNSGSEANELAIRMAKVTTGRDHMIAIKTGYHGNTNAVINVSSYKFDGKGGHGRPHNTSLLPLPDPFRGKFCGSNTGASYAEDVYNIIDELSKKNIDIAALIAEPILSCGGQIVPPPSYFKQVYEHIRNAGGLCIADEVQTGFGRIGSHFWAFEMHQVVPDIVTMGKPAGNGHPLGVVACTKEVAEAFNNGMEYFNTFGGNPVSCSIGLAVLETIEQENLQEQAHYVGGYLKKELQRLQQEFPIIGDVRGEGLFLGVEFSDALRRPLAAQATYLMERMKTHRILTSTDGPDHNVIKIKPPLVFSLTDADRFLTRFRSILTEDFMRVTT